MRPKSLVGSLVVAMVCVGLANVGAQCNEDGGGRTGTTCSRDPGRTDTSYGFIGFRGANGCAENYRCFAEVGEREGKCSPGVRADECVPAAPPYADGYSAAPSRDCTSGQVCELRGAPPVGRGYIGYCIPAPAPDAGPAPPPVTLTCGSPIPDRFVHAEGRTVDYEIKDCDLDVLKAVVVEPGTVIAMGEGRSIRVGKGGSFSAVGRADKRIKIRSLGAPRWASIIFFAKSPANELAFVDIAQGSGPPLPEGHATVIVGASAFAGGDVSIRDCVFGGSGGDDISVGEDGDLRALQRNVFDSGGYPITLTPHLVDRFSDDNEVRSSKKFVNVRADGPPIARDVTWAKLRVPYHVSGSIELRGAHSIAKGVSLVMGPDSNIRVGASANQAENGKLLMIGTSAEKIDVRGEAGATSGSWGGIHIQTSTANSLQFVSLRGGGGPAAAGDPKGMVFLDPNLAGTAVSIRDCVFEASKGWGIVVNGQTINADVETANTFTNNALGGVSP